MYLKLFVEALIMGFFISVPIGPMGILVIQRTVNRNLKSGIFTGLGIASTDAIWILIAGFSVSYIVTFIETYQSYIQIIGAIILFLLGLNIFMSHPIKAMKEIKRKGSSPFQCYITAMALSFSNPLIILAYIALLASTKIVFNINDMLEPAIFFSAFFMGGLCWWFTLAFSINLFRHRFNLRALWWFNKISGAIIMLFIIISTIYVLIKGNPVI